MKNIKLSASIATVVAVLMLFGVTISSAQQKRPQKVEKKTEEKVNPAAPVKSNPVVVKDSTLEKKPTDSKMKKIVPKAKPAGK